MNTSPHPPRFWALVPCAGTGSRALGRNAAAGPKQYRPIAGQPLVLHTLAALAGVTRLQAILVGVAPGDSFFIAHTHPAWFAAPCGGETRADTVLGGLRVLQERGAAKDDWVLVHDAARCLITTAQVEALIDTCAQDSIGGLLALPLADTLKAAAHYGTDGVRVTATLSRAGKWLAQTPQMFRIGTLRHALERFGNVATDEASAMEALGLHPLLVTGSVQNFKVTWPEDFALAEAVLLARRKQP